MSSAIICFIVCIPLSGLISALSMQSIVIASIVLAIIFLISPNKLFLFTLFSFCTSEMFNGSLFGLEFDISTTSYSMSIISTICTLSLLFIIVIKKALKLNYNVRYVDLSNTMIRCIILFIFTQFLATILSSDISVSLNKVSSLIQHLLWFYICIVFIHEIKIFELVNFLAIAIICGTFYIYNLLILGQLYGDDSNIIYFLPFLINVTWPIRLKILSNIYSIFIGSQFFN